MLPKLNIQEKIKEQKAVLIDRLLEETKLPITDVRDLTFNSKDYKGSLWVKIGKADISLPYQYENNTFLWDITVIYKRLSDNWIKIYKEHKSNIEAKIFFHFNIPTENEISITVGIKNEIYIKGIGGTQIKVLCEYIKNEWQVKKI